MGIGDGYFERGSSWDIRIRRWRSEDSFRRAEGIMVFVLDLCKVVGERAFGVGNFTVPIDFPCGNDHLRK